MSRYGKMRFTVICIGLLALLLTGCNEGSGTSASGTTSSTTTSASSGTSTTSSSVKLPTTSTSTTVTSAGQSAGSSGYTLMRGPALYIDPYIYGGGGASKANSHAATARRLGAKWVQMSVMWKDLQYGENSFSFQSLSDYIGTLQAQGFGVSMRLYAGSSWDTPGFIMWAQPARGEDLCNAVAHFCQALASFLSARGTLPVEWQLSGSGPYGEMAVTDGPKPEWWRVRDFMLAQMSGARSGGFANGFSACFNAQWNEGQTVSLISALHDNGLIKLQQNCAFWCIENCPSWGQETIDWLIRFKRDMGIAMVVEDQESGVPSHYSDGCGQWPGFEALQDRLNRWRGIAGYKGIDPAMLDGVTWDPQDDRNNNYGSDSWNQLFGT